MSNTSTDREVPDQQDQPVTADRRTILRAAGLVVLGGSAAVGLTACASGTAGPTATSAPPTSAAPSSVTPPPLPPPSSVTPPPLTPSSPSTSASSSAPAPTGPSVATADVKVGSGVILQEPNNYVVTQPTKGTYKAFTSICTHQGCPVAEIRGTSIVCNCHGSEFSIEDGSVVKEPASEPLKEFPATVSGNKVYIDV